MAIDSAKQLVRAGPEMLRRSYARAAAAASVCASVAAIVLLLRAMTTAWADNPALVVPGAIWIAMFAGALLAARQLIRGKEWAQQVLLAFWELLLIAAVCFLLAGIVYGPGKTWQHVPLGGAGGIWLAVGLAAAGGIAALLTAASRKGSRLRYSSVVTGTVAIAIALMLAVNIVAQHDYLRKSVESYGLYRLSDRSRTVIDGLDEPVRLTCVYGGAGENTARYGEATLELLREMADYAGRRGKQIEVINANTDTARRAVLAEIDSKISTKAGGHIAYLRSFITDSGPLIEAIRAEAEVWRHLPVESYVNLWDVTAQAKMLSSAADSLEALRSRLAPQVGPTTMQFQPGREIVPNYAKLTSETVAELNTARKCIVDIPYALQRMQALAQAVATKKPALAEQINLLDESRKAMVEAVGSPDSPAPLKPREMMAEFVQRATVLAQRTQGLADSLANLAGPGNSAALNASSAWWVELRNEQGVVGRMWPPDLMMSLSLRTADLAQGVGGAVKDGNDEFLSEQVLPLRRQAKDISESFANASGQILNTLDRLVEIDPTSRRLMDLVQGGELMRNLIDMIDPLLDRAEQLQPLKDESLPEKLKQDNVVIVEIGDAIDVVPSQAVWPMKYSIEQTTAEGEAADSRLFNGNTAISSKLLSMTAPPLATVVVSYYRSVGDPTGGQIDPGMLGELYGRLSDSNLEVLFWNVISPPPKILQSQGEGEATYGDRPVVLLVLPPPGPVIAAGEDAPPSFGQKELARVKGAIDSGTPAVFLGSYLWPTMGIPTPYQYREYLRQEWGIDVRSDYLIVPAVRDETSPGRFKLNYQWLGHLPLNLFSDQAIGAPLTGQQVFWLFCCPVEIAAKLPPRVSVAPILSIPSAWGRSTWATSRVGALIDQAGRGLISPDYPGGDLPIPQDDVGMPLAVAAARPAEDSGGEGQPDNGKPVRIVVMGMGMSFMDGYMDRPAGGGADDGRRASDPPRANADLVINSIYWLVGREDLIASGPPQAKPIRTMSGRRLAVLQLLCVVVLPALVLGAGGLVLAVRRR